MYSVTFACVSLRWVCLFEHTLCKLTLKHFGVNLMFTSQFIQYHFQIYILLQNKWKCLLYSTYAFAHSEKLENHVSTAQKKETNTFTHLYTYIHKHNLKAIRMRSIILKPLTMQTINVEYFFYIQRRHYFRLHVYGHT